MMKNDIVLFSIILIFLFGCHQAKQEPNKCAIVWGKIEKKSTDKISFYHWKGLENLEDSARLDSNGNFYIAINLDREQLCEFNYENNYSTIYLKPGDSLYLTFSVDYFNESLQFKGLAADINNYLIDYSLNLQNDKFSTTFLKFSEDSFKVAALDYRNEMEDHFNNFINTSKTKISENFIKLQTNRILYQWATMYTIYPLNYKYLNKRELEMLKPDFENYLAQLNLNDTSIIGLDKFQLFLSNYLGLFDYYSIKKDTTLKTDFIKRFTVELAHIKNIFKGKNTYDYVISYMVSHYVESNGINGIEAYLDDYYKECHTEEYRKVVQKKCAKWNKLSKGNVASEFDMIDSRNNKFSLSDFKGKFIYIDVWATWCGPCKKEKPYLVKLEKEFSNKNIAFLKISVDDDKLAWQNMLKEEAPRSLNFWSGGWESELRKNYLIQSIPRFILIDKEGKLIDANAPRPSANIRAVLNQLKGIN